MKTLDAHEPRKARKQRKPLNLDRAREVLKERLKETDGETLDQLRAMVSYHKCRLAEYQMCVAYERRFPGACREVLFEMFGPGLGR